MDVFGSNEKTGMKDQEPPYVPIRVVNKNGEEKTHKIQLTMIVKDFFDLVGIKDFYDGSCYINGDLRLYKPWWMNPEKDDISSVIDFVVRKDEERKLGVMTLMLFTSSGKSGFENYKRQDPNNKKMIDKETLKMMYTRENELRLSEQVQEEMDQCIMSNVDEYANILERIQRSVLEEFGYKEESDLEVFREMLGFYSSDQEISSIPYYSKFNRAKDGNLCVGDEMIDANLVDIDNPHEIISLKTLYKNELEKKSMPPSTPFVIIAGSIT